MTTDLPGPDTTAEQPLAAVCQDGVALGVAAEAVIDTKGREIRLELSAASIDDGRRTRRIPLDDPSRPGFLELPLASLPDGRSLRAAAFTLWAANLRARLSAGARWETTYLPRKPYHTGFAILGAALVGGGALWSVLRWASSDPQVSHRPGLFDGLALLAAVALLLWLAYATLSSAVRYWLCRRGSYLRVDLEGVTVTKGGRPRPASEIVAAEYHPWIRATELHLRDGRRVWIPRERGPLVRPDLVLAALPGGPPASSDGTDFTCSLPLQGAPELPPPPRALPEK